MVPRSRALGSAWRAAAGGGAFKRDLRICGSTAYEHRSSTLYEMRSGREHRVRARPWPGLAARGALRSRNPGHSRARIAAAAVELADERGLRGGLDAPRRPEARRRHDDALPLRRQQGRAGHADGRHGDGGDPGPGGRARRATGAPAMAAIAEAQPRRAARATAGCSTGSATAGPGPTGCATSSSRCRRWPAPASPPQAMFEADRAGRRVRLRLRDPRGAGARRARARLAARGARVLPARTRQRRLPADPRASSAPTPRRASDLVAEVFFARGASSAASSACSTASKPGSEPRASWRRRRAALARRLLARRFSPAPACAGGPTRA